MLCDIYVTACFLITKPLTYLLFIVNYLHPTHKTMALKLAPHKDEILALYDSGMTMTEIAERFSCYQQPVSNLIKKYREVSSRAGTVDSTYFDRIDTHLKAYFAGFIAGDGCLVKSSTSSSITLTITLNKRDECILEKLREELQMSRPLWYFVSQKRFDHVRLVTSDKGIVAGLKAIGIDHRKSLTMGNILQNIPEVYRSSFILGLFDADGSCCVREAISKTQGREYKSIKQSVQIRATLDMCAAIVQHLGLQNYHISTSDSIPNLVISSKKEFTNFFNQVYKDCPFYLQRKYEKFLPIVHQDQTISSPEV